MIVDTLGELVKYPTITEDIDANHEALDHVELFMAHRGMHVNRYVFNGHPALVASTRPDARNARVMVASHMDVVPAASPSAFQPDIVGDKFYSRGSLDMKFNAATIMEIVDDLYESGNLAEYDFVSAFTSEEETGGTDGTKQLLEMGYRPEVCILPDGGDDWQIQTGSKGFFHYAIRATGESAHSRAPWEGSNAILKASQAMLAIQGLFPPKSEMGPDTPTNSPNEVHGGLFVNQVPDTCEYRLDARFTSETQKEHFRQAIGKICLAHGVEMDILVDGKATHFDLDNPYIAPFRRLVTEVTGIEVGGSRTLGSSDARFFAEYGIPVVSLYPTGGGHHSEQEWISIKALHQYKDVLRMYLDQMAKVPLLTSEAAAERSTEPA